MTPTIGLVFGILAVALFLFVTGKVRMDLVALLVLGALALTGLLTTEQALSGFSSPAVVTVWAMFILSAALTRTGIANLIGRPIRRFAKGGELQLMVALMTVAGLLSALINTVTVAAILLPVTMDLARRTRRPPSRLLMPMSLGCLLGGPFTAISTPPNILVTDSLRNAGLTPFSLFEFTPITAALLAAGILFMLAVGQRLLPKTPAAGATDSRGVGTSYQLQEHLFTARIDPASALVGKTLGQSRLGSALHLTVLAIRRAGRPLLRAPGPGEELQAGDELILHGLPDHLQAMHGREHLAIEPLGPAADLRARLMVTEARLPEGSPLVGQRIAETGLRREHRVHVLALRREGEIAQHDLAPIRLAAGHRLLLQGERRSLEELQDEGLLEGLRPLSEEEVAEIFRLEAELLALRVPEGSVLAGHDLAESRLGNAFGLTVVGIARGEALLAMPDPSERLEPDDLLLVQGSRDDLEVMAALQDLRISEQTEAQVEELESQHAVVTEVVLSPRTSIAGTTLRDLLFRDRYGLTVLALWREGRPYRSELRDLELRFGDALLVYGPRRRLEALASDSNFLVLDQSAARAPRLEKAPLAAVIMASVLTAAMLGWAPIAIAAVVGAAGMVLARCISMEEAYRAIDWQAVFLIAGMLPLGIALEQTGAAQLVAEGVLEVVGGLGPRAVMAGLFLITMMGTQVMPNPAVVVLVSPIALSASASAGISPYTLMMTVALAASASFASPVAHPAHLLVMGPGGYRFVDYVRIGAPLTVVAFVVILGLVPLMWPP